MNKLKRLNNRTYLKQNLKKLKSNQSFVLQTIHNNRAYIKAKKTHNISSIIKLIISSHRKKRIKFWHESIKWEFVFLSILTHKQARIGENKTSATKTIHQIVNDSL